MRGAEPQEGRKDHAALSRTDNRLSVPPAGGNDIGNSGLEGTPSRGGQVERFPDTLKMTRVRLQKVLAERGVASRRASEEIIRQGRVAVNDVTVTELGYKVDPGADRIVVDGAVISNPEPKFYVVLHKPRLCITTASDPQGRKTVFDLIPDFGVRLFAVGRLDFDAAGLLLLTNDGPLANRLQHPRYGVPKTYEVRVEGCPDERTLDRLRSGVQLEEGTTAPAEVTMLRDSPKGAWLRIVLHQGWNRQIKRMGETVGHPVLSIRRVAYGPLKLGRSAPGDWRLLDPREVRLLYALVHLDKEQAKANG